MRLTRDEYIRLRMRNAEVTILYCFAEQHGFRQDSVSFMNFFMVWAQRIGADLAEFYLKSVINHYDNYFSLQLIFKDVEVEVQGADGVIRKIKQQNLWRII